jgi:hypothetical protein
MEEIRDEGNHTESFGSTGDEGANTTTSNGVRLTVPARRRYVPTHLRHVNSDSPIRSTAAAALRPKLLRLLCKGAGLAAGARLLAIPPSTATSFSLPVQRRPRVVAGAIISPV